MTYEMQNGCEIVMELHMQEKEVVRFGFVKQPNGLWDVRQIFPHFQNIISNHRAYFDGSDPYKKY